MFRPDKSIVVFFGNGLSDQQFRDDDVRKQTLENGVREIVGHVSGLRILRTNPLSCTASVIGPVSVVEKLKQFLDSFRGTSYQEDDPKRPMLRATRD
jgi:hypothetical protein